jgi:hypothetical protein
MLSVRDEITSPLDAAHRAKLAYIYIRQSTAGQVRQHQESTTLQYRLVDRAAGLGWPRERIVVVDDDLGKSGTASTERQGFQRLIAEIGLVPYRLTLDTICIKKIPSNQCRNDGGLGEAFRRGGRSPSGLGQVIAVCPGDALDHSDVEHAAQLA